MDDLLAATDSNDFRGISEDSPHTHHLGPRSPYGFGSYLGCLLGFSADSLKRGNREAEAFLKSVQQLDEAEEFGIREFQRSRCVCIT
ncbi:MAG: hypothetical protein CVU43_16405 [Chloroflexi bacterium HGW-Chloroflexi-5]|jgi:hypothetical protein|nr:MAG: hypothetical protein CVU43_16405 [Chloroflexi bacterium HGW-Chloroflexi-5]